VPDVILKANGRDFGGWLNLKASSSLGQLAGTFSLGLTERWPDQAQKRAIQPGDSCQLYLGNQLIITGWVDSVDVSYGPKEHRLEISGRDKTCDLVDCCFLDEPQVWKDRYLLQIARDLCRAWDVEPILLGVDQGERFKEIAYSPGDTVMSLIRKLCRQRGILPTSYGNGQLILTRPGHLMPAATLKLGENIKSGRLNQDHSSRFSVYQVRGQAKPNNQAVVYELHPSGNEGARTETLERITAAQSQASPLATISDLEITRYRPLLLVAEAPGDLAAMETRASWEKTTRKGKSRRVSYTVQGWQQSQNQIWNINQLVKVEDDFLGINEQMLVESVSFSLEDGSGSTTELGLVPPEAYQVEPPDQSQTQRDKEKQTVVYDVYLDQ
jgi:prophage tail gpP-like protein